ncbi:MAG: ZIP family metal transporter [Candidatus Shapirobacteria bacterium]
MNPILIAAGVSLLMSLLSLTGLFFFKVRKNILKRELLTLVGLATGALLGDAFLHLIPESMKIIESEKTGLMIIIGIMIFFVLEKILKWRHCHNVECDQKSHLGEMSIAADSIHNLIDGLIITGSFGVSVPTGIATSLAVMLHEIPQEIGDLAILIHSGLSLKKASLMNLSSALFSLIGVAMVWIIGNKVNINGELMGLTAGGFIYLAASDLIPELHRHQSQIRETIWQLITVIFGIGIMYFLV